VHHGSMCMPPEKRVSIAFMEIATTF